LPPLLTLPYFIARHRKNGNRTDTKKPSKYDISGGSVKYVFRSTIYWQYAVAAMTLGVKKS